MKATAEIEIEVSERKDVFMLVEASKLRLDDEFLMYDPRNRFFKEEVIEVIKAGLKDFYRPICDPSFDVDGRICYEIGKKPAGGKNYNWWEENAKDFCPERASRLGTRSEYIAFLAVLIKDLVANGWDVADAWDAVSEDSKALGHYWDPNNYKLEDTGSRGICGFFDLANTGKILAKDKEEHCFWLASGCYGDNCDEYPLANLEPMSEYDITYDWNSNMDYGCGWLVLEHSLNC